MSQIKPDIDLKSYRSNCGKIEIIDENFGIKDCKGREVGCKGSITKETYIKTPPNKDTYCSYCIPVGTWFMVRLQKTKNGVEFGATQAGTYFDNIKDCWEYINKRKIKMKKIRKFILCTHYRVLKLMDIV